ncbi:nuclear transport factor 2 family protein [Prosthecobacter sp.]|uniref:nuclear transport factor 2 family protein n=1 Tax=Prosthecobacter sp. TaxID=1965333 RepID=UPI002487202F|nr:nuclear transport factor 2 family protein [Prosthecobacter sp.]MDI1312058.1 nuclear transport factor 2 family protein [Prosthecobacter sp.]
MKTTPPQVLSDYFAAVNDGRTDDAAACFSADALVHDESHDHQGREVIRAWMEETTLKYHPKVVVTQIQDVGRAFAATGMVSGTFPGSPLQFDYTFTVSGEEISHLSIR